MSRAGSDVDYPYTSVVGELATLVSKEQWLALTVDLVREQVGEDVADEALQAFVVRRLDVLKNAGVVPRSVPARVRYAIKHQRD